MRPVIWLLSVSTDALVRLLGGDPKATGEELSGEELRDLVSTHEGLQEQERQILQDVFEATRTSLREVMRPRTDVQFVAADMPLVDAERHVRSLPYSRYPVTGEGFDDVLGFLHVRDLLHVGTDDTRTVRDVVRDVLVLPGTNPVLPAMSVMRQERTHLAVVVDEYGGTDGIVTLEDLVEELVGDIHDEYDAPAVRGDAAAFDGSITLEDFTRHSGVPLEDDGRYETVAGYVIARLGRLPEVGDTVEVAAPDGGATLEVTGMTGPRVTRLALHRPSPEADGTGAAGPGD